MAEEWRACTASEDYEVSSLGRVRSLKSRNHGLIMAVFSAGPCRRYRAVGLTLDGKNKAFLVHRLIASAFCENPAGKPFVNHIDGNPSNNSAANLEWCTAKENTHHSKTVLGHSKPPNMRLDWEQAEAIRLRRREGASVAALAAEYGVGDNTIRRVLRGLTYRAESEAA